MKKMESKRSHSWWWDSHITPKNSKCLQQDLQDMDLHVKKMLKLIEEDADSFTKKVEIYYQKRPELINLVEEVYRMYRSLAERYDHVTGELRKNIPSDLHSQCSGITDLGSEPPSAMPSPSHSRRQSGHRAPGFDFFLGHYVGNESPTMESESESDDSSVHFYSGMQGNDEEPRKVMEFELKMQEEGVMIPGGDERFDKAARLYEEQLRLARRKIQQSEEEVRRLNFELHKYNNSTHQATEVQESMNTAEPEPRILTLWEEHRLTREKLRESEQEVARLRQECELKMAPKDISVWKNKLEVEEEKAEVAKLQDCIARYKTNLADRDQEIRELKEAISDANYLYQEIEQLKAEIDDKNYCIEELKVNLDELVNEKDDLNMSIFELGRDLSSKDDQIDQMSSHLTSKDDQIDQMSNHLNEMHAEHVDLIAKAEGARKLAEDLRLKVKELEKEVEKKQQIIVLGAEEKREAIRQLCFSLEHYRNGYHRLREVVTGPKATTS